PRRSTTRALHSLVRVGFGAGAFHRTAGEVGVRVLVVHGSDDHHVPVDFAIAATACHPGWDLRIVADAGHDAHAEQPEQWLAIVGAWLDALPAAAP
ncbi:MAG TPA: hypothetical protein VGK92_00485, partial [Gaiellales bacterium]